MDDRLARLEAQFEQLTTRLAAFEQRLAALETQPAAGARRAAAGAPQLQSPFADLGASDLGGMVALVGRTLLVLAGAYLLRALTDSGTVSAGPGVLMGLAFATVWIIMAGRVTAKGVDAAFHAVAFVLIALPLLFEATARFHFLTPVGAAAGLGIFAAAALAVAVQRRLEAFAWVTTLGALATAVALMLATAEVAPFALFLVLLGLATLWLGYVLDWRLLRWPVALVADLTIVVLSGRAVTPDVADSPTMALVVQIFLLVTYLGSVGARTLFLHRDVIPFEVAQSIAVIAVGLGGATYVTAVTGAGVLALGIATLALSAGCYGTAVAFIDRRRGPRRNFYFYTSAGLVLAMAGCSQLLPGTVLAVVLAGLGLAAAYAGRLWSRIVFHIHGAIYLTAAVMVSGLLFHVFYGLGVPVTPRQAASTAVLAVLAACVTATWAFGGGVEGSPGSTRVPRLIVLVLALGGLLGVVVTWSLPAIDGTTRSLHPGAVAALRTALLVAFTLALAWADRGLGFVEGGWLVYPLMILTGVKFVVEDIRAGQPATLVLSFACYGVALILGPRLRRRTGG